MITSNCNPPLNLFLNEMPLVQDNYPIEQDGDLWKLTTKRAPTILDFPGESPVKKARGANGSKILKFAGSSSSKPVSGRMQTMRATAKEEETPLGPDFIPARWHVVSFHHLFYSSC